MSTSQVSRTDFSSRSALIVGLGGLGCPAAWVLARAGVGRIVLADDDTVELSNLHRQILYGDEDVGGDKLDAAVKGLRGWHKVTSAVEVRRSRLLPENARDWVREVDIVVEGADNFATKFLAADACRLERRTIVHGAAVRWHSTSWCVGPDGKPCYRCLFEDVPDRDSAPNCAEAGVMGPVVGFAGALLGELTLRALAQKDVPFGKVFTYDGKLDSLRQIDVRARADCPLCGTLPRIHDIQKQRYTAPSCAA
jgi:molybdopterin/thiamine biosynthesis adenylyltransferase